MSTAIIVDIESPYNAATPALIERNILYARLCCRWALMEGYIPFASHLFYTQPGILDDQVPVERELGILAGKSLIKSTNSKSLFFMDLGESTGMTFGREDALQSGRPFEDIYLFDNGANLSSLELLLKEAARKNYITLPYRRDGW